MSVDLLAIVAPGLKIVAPEIAKKINSALNPTDLEKALKAGAKSAEEWDSEQSYQGEHPSFYSSKKCKKSMRR